MSYKIDTYDYNIETVSVEGIGAGLLGFLVSMQILGHGSVSGHLPYVHPMNPDLAMVCDFARLATHRKDWKASQGRLWTLAQQAQRPYADAMSHRLRVDRLLDRAGGDGR